MVQREQPGQRVRVGLVPAELVDEVDLALHQRLAAPGQRDEHRLHLHAQQRLVGGEAQGLPVHGAERGGQLTDLVRTGWSMASIRADESCQRGRTVVGVAGGDHVGDRGGQLDPGRGQRGVPGAAQPPADAHQRSDVAPPRVADDDNQPSSAAIS